MRTLAEYVAHFQGKSYMETYGWEYFLFHLRRYGYLLDEVAGRIGEQDRPRILDIGMSFQTELFRQRFPTAIVDTLGFGDPRFVESVNGRHWEMNLNDAAFPERWLEPREHDVLVMAEVIEHLYTPPHLVLRMLEGYVKPGGTLVLQTPNPVALGRRWATLRGVNPYEMIRDGIGNPGHFCEYTPADLAAIVARTKFSIASVAYSNYFGPEGWRNKLYDVMCKMLPGDLHDGITVVLRRE